MECWNKNRSHWTNILKEKIHRHPFVVYVLIYPLSKFWGHSDKFPRSFSFLQCLLQVIIVDLEVYCNLTQKDQIAISLVKFGIQKVHGAIMLEVADDLHWALAKCENPDMDMSICWLFLPMCLPIWKGYRGSWAGSFSLSSSGEISWKKYRGINA